MRIPLASNEPVRKFVFFGLCSRICWFGSLHEFCERVVGELLFVRLFLTFNFLLGFLEHFHMGHARIVNYFLKRSVQLLLFLDKLGAHGRLVSLRRLELGVKKLHSLQIRHVYRGGVWQELHFGTNSRRALRGRPYTVRT